MNTSPSRARLPPSAGIGAPREPAEVLPFPYNEAVVRTSPPSAQTESALPGRGESDALVVAAQAAERELRARELGRQQGASESRAKFEEQLAGERSAVAKALSDFARERATYYQKIEEEAVGLALSIARKILHRESQVDPLLLMGIVRVALERIEGATGVALAVHPEQGAAWRNYLTTRMAAGDLPEIVEDAAMAVEQCELRTSMGTAALGLEVQLKEIEQGLMDLLAARPQAKPQEKAKPQERAKPQEKEQEKGKEKEKDKP